MVNDLWIAEGGPEAHQNKGAPATLPWLTSQRTGPFDHPPCPLSHGFRPRRYSRPQLLLAPKGFCYTLGFEPGLISDASSAKPYATVPVIHCPPVVILQISEPHAVVHVLNSFDFIEIYISVFSLTVVIVFFFQFKIEYLVVLLASKIVLTQM